MIEYASGSLVLPLHATLSNPGRSRWSLENLLQNLVHQSKDLGRVFSIHLDSNVSVSHIVPELTDFMGSILRVLTDQISRPHRIDLLNQAAGSDALLFGRGFDHRSRHQYRGHEVFDAVGFVSFRSCSTNVVGHVRKGLAFDPLRLPSVRISEAPKLNWISQRSFMQVGFDVRVRPSDRQAAAVGTLHRRVKHRGVHSFDSVFRRSDLRNCVSRSCWLHRRFLPAPSAFPSRHCSSWLFRRFDHSAGGSAQPVGCVS